MNEGSLQFVSQTWEPFRAMNAEPSRQQMHRRYRRRILAWGSAALLVVFVLGSAITLPRVESELEDRVDAAAVAAGVDGLTSSFSGQDGTLRCTNGTVVSDEMLSQLSGLRGVRKLTVGASCGEASVGDDPTDGVAIDEATVTTASAAPEETIPVTDPVEAGPAPTEDLAGSGGDGSDDDEDDVAPTESVLDAVGNDSQFSTLADLIDDAGLGGDLSVAGAITLFAPTNDAFQTLGPDILAALGRDPELLSAVLRHHITANEVLASQFVLGEIEMLDGTSVSVSPGAAPIDAAIVSGEVTAALTAVDLLATNGVVHGVDAVLLPPGFELAGGGPPTTTTVPEPVEAGEADAAGLELELNAFVSANPILFEPGSADIAAASQPVIDQIAALATQLTGINIEVQGHTDTDGNPGRNQTLSENRAASVRDALVAAGVDAGSVASSGFGGTRTIVDASGVEDKAASRRVEFVVTTV